MRVGITGGNGFIGGWTATELVGREHVPVIFDRHHPPDPATDIVLGDVRDAGAVLDLAEHVDGIIHLAGVLGTQETVAAPLAAAEVNIIGGLNVLEAAKLTGIPVVNICVGNHWMRNTYSTSKRTVERFAEQYRDEDGVRVNQVRCVNAYGPWQRPARPFGSGTVRKMVPWFACSALSKMPVEVYGDGLQVSDCVHVRDVADVLVSALEHAARGVIVPTVEVGPFEHTTVLDVADLVVELACTDAPITFLPMRPGEQVGRPVIADDPLTCLTVDVDPEWFIPLRDGLAETVDWFAKHEGTHWVRPR